MAYLVLRTRWRSPVVAFYVGASLLLVAGISDRCLAAVPTLEPLADVTLLSGSPLHIPLNGSDLDGHPLSFSATSGDSLVTPFVPQGNRSMRISVGGYGDMVFELFEGRAPRVTEQIIELASSGDYNGVPFHRVIDGFMIQTGDIINGNGTGGSRLDDFDDQFHVDLQHNQSGILSMAKSGDDTNDSQFFITEGPTRWLDFNHSIFGQLVEGESVREAISNAPTDANDKPITDILMDSVEIFADVENGVLMISAPEGTTGSANVTVTVSDGVEWFEQVFQVSVGPDPWDGGPFLAEIDPPVFAVEPGVPGTLQLEAVDVEGDPVVFAQNDSQVPAGTTAATDAETGLVTITPAADFVGTFDLLVGVRAEIQSDTSDLWDTQWVPIRVLPEELPGDMDQDGDVDFDDIDEFVLGLSRPLDYEAAYGVLPTRNGDIDGDGDQDFDDIPGYVALLRGSSIASVPEPSTGMLFGVAVAALVGWWRIR